MARRVEDNWAHRSKEMRCGTCMWFAEKRAKPSFLMEKGKPETMEPMEDMGREKLGRCPLCTCQKEEETTGQGGRQEGGKRRIGQQKQAKRGGGSKPYMYRRGKYEKSDRDVGPKVKV